MGAQPPRHIARPPATVRLWVRGMRFGFEMQKDSQLRRQLLGIYVAAACLIFFCGSLKAEPSARATRALEWGWKLPQNLSDTNTTVRFYLDSTWHNLHGSSSGISGRAWLENAEDPLSLRATLNFPVTRLTTGGEMRDERMREVMDSNHHRYVTLAIDFFEPKCPTISLMHGEPCPTELKARLSIRGNERAIVLPGILTRTRDSVSLSGEVTFSWLDFGVEDPSILIAKLEPTMKAAYTVTLPAMELIPG